MSDFGLVGRRRSIPMRLQGGEDVGLDVGCILACSNSWTGVLDEAMRDARLSRHLVSDCS